MSLWNGSPATPSEGTTAELRCDLLVVGAGMAGLTAAGRAARAGAEVVVVEKRSTIGGSAAISGGHLWTVRSVAEHLAECPTADPRLAERLVADFDHAVAWVRSLGTWMSEEVGVLGIGRGHRIDILGYLDRCRALVESGGGWVIPDRTVESLIVDSGAVRGAVVIENDEPLAVRAPWTVLATGGFAASRRLVGRHIADPAQVSCRCAPGAEGDGLALGIQAGAAHAGGLGNFYGHLLVWPVDDYAEKDYVPLSAFYSPLGLLVNLAGRRFVDESLSDHRNSQAVARQPEGRALLLMDADMHATALDTPAAEGKEWPDPFVYGEARGAHTVVAREIAGILAAAQEWGFDPAGVRSTLEGYERAVTARRAGELEPPRSRRALHWGRAPFRAMEVRAGVTITHGGLAIDTSARVLDPSGEPIPGLLAAGADAGGLNDDGYTGGLAPAAVFGLAAADLATDSA